MKRHALFHLAAAFALAPMAFADDMIAPTHPGLREGEAGDTRERAKEAAIRQNEQKTYNAPPVADAIIQAYESLATSLEAIPEEPMDVLGEMSEEGVTLAGKHGEFVFRQESMMKRLADWDNLPFDTGKMDLAGRAKSLAKYAPNSINYAEPISVTAGHLAEGDYSGAAIKGGTSATIAFASSAAGLWAGTKAGALAGTAFGGPVGTFCGALVGIGTSCIVGWGMKAATNDLADSAAQAITDYGTRSRTLVPRDLPPPPPGAGRYDLPGRERSPVAEQIGQLEALGIIGKQAGRAASPGIAPPPAAGDTRLEDALAGLAPTPAPAPAPAAIPAPDPSGVMESLRQQAAAESAVEVTSQIESRAEQEVDAERRAAEQRRRDAIAAENRRRAIAAEQARRAAIEAQQRLIGQAVGNALADAIDRAYSEPAPRREEPKKKSRDRKPDPPKNKAPAPAPKPACPPSGRCN